MLAKSWHSCDIETHRDISSLGVLRYKNGGFMDWVHSRLPGQIDPSAEYEVWLDGGQVRTVRRQWGLYPCMVFTDCSSPIANAVLQEQKVKAWRITGRHPQQIAFEGNRQPSPPPVLTPAQIQYQAQNQSAQRIDNPMAANYRPDWF